MNSKNRRKYLLPAAVLLIGFLCVVSYFIFCPVRTFGETLALKNPSIHAENCYSVSVLPRALSGLKEDYLSVGSKHPHDTFIDLENQEKDCFFSLLSSLKVRKKLGEYHEFSSSHRQEKGYYYIIFCHGSFDLSICLCNEELCFASNPEKRFGSFPFNTYYLADCPENKEILNEILEFLKGKAGYYA